MFRGTSDVCSTNDNVIMIDRFIDSYKISPGVSAVARQSTLFDLETCITTFCCSASGNVSRSEKGKGAPSIQWQTTADGRDR